MPLIIAVFMALMTIITPTPVHADGHPATGRWLPAYPEKRDSGAAGGDVRRMMSLPYLQGYYPPPPQSGVVRYDRSRIHSGLNLYCSGHRAEAGLMDMTGRVLHIWTYDLKDLWPDAISDERATFWRRVRLDGEGNLLAIYGTIGMIKLDRDSRLVWASRARQHHDLQVLGDGTIVTLTRREERLPELQREFKTLDEFVTELGPDGKVRREHSIFYAFYRSPFRRLINTRKGGAEIMHTNTIKILDGSQAKDFPAFRKGNALIALREMNTLAVMDLREDRIVWAVEGREAGLWNELHDPAVLADGNILLFDNLGDDSGHGRSRVIELDPRTLRVVWEYGGTDDAPLDSPTCGTVQRLDNGNTLITETDRGRAVEVTPAGEIVWEFVNPHRAGEDGELIATLLQVGRIPPERAGWLK